MKWCSGLSLDFKAMGMWSERRLKGRRFPLPPPWSLRSQGTAGLLSMICGESPVQGAFKDPPNSPNQCSACKEESEQRKDILSASRKPLSSKAPPALHIDGTSDKSQAREAKVFLSHPSAPRPRSSAGLDSTKRKM